MDLTSSTIGEVFARYEELKGQEEELKAQIAEVREEIEEAVERAGGRLIGYGWDATITSAAQIISYDPRAVENVIAQLVKAGQTELAMELAAGRKVANRTPHLRVARSK